MNLFKSMTTGLMATLCTLSLWNIPSQAHAQCCQQEECCEGGGSWWSSNQAQAALIIGGAAVVGGIAGAVAGNATGGGHGHGHKGARGPRGFTGDPGTGLVGPVGPVGPTGATGPVGPSSFVADAAGNTLTFASTLTPTIAAVGVFLVTPFVTYPDGTTLEGPAITTALIGPLVIPPIVAGALVFGNYEYGIQITPTGGATIANLGLGLLANVTASRDGSVTTIGSPAALTAGVSLVATGAQYSLDFTYDDATVP